MKEVKGGRGEEEGEGGASRSNGLRTWRSDEECWVNLKRERKGGSVQEYDRGQRENRRGKVAREVRSAEAKRTERGQRCMRAGTGLSSILVWRTVTAGFHNLQCNRCWPACFCLCF